MYRSLAVRLATLLTRAVRGPAPISAWTALSATPAMRILDSSSPAELHSTRLLHCLAAETSVDDLQLMAVPKRKVRDSTQLTRRMNVTKTYYPHGLPA